MDKATVVYSGLKQRFRNYICNALSNVTDEVTYNIPLKGDGNCFQQQAS
jgi:hypothetical protein